MEREANGNVTFRSFFELYLAQFGPFWEVFFRAPLPGIHLFAELSFLSRGLLWVLVGKKSVVAVKGAEMPEYNWSETKTERIKKESL